MAKKKKFEVTPDANGEIKINVGCGEFRNEDWINIDKTKVKGGPKPDIVASADDLPFKDGTVHKIYAGHVLEHIEFEKIPSVLAEFKRVLVEDGVLVIVGPDLTRAEYAFPSMIDDIKYGADRWDGDKHLWDSRESVVYRLLVDNDWLTTPYPIASPDLNAWPVTARVGWQFALAATPMKT